MFLVIALVPHYAVSTRVRAAAAPARGVRSASTHALLTHEAPSAAVVAPVTTSATPLQMEPAAVTDGSQEVRVKSVSRTL